MDGRRAVAAALVLAGGALGVHAAWIPAKARLAQALLERAWSRARAGAARPRPWPWADTHPVARMEVPRLGVREIVLAGASGRVLAFGPAHVAGTAPPGGEGNCVLVGHRDTSFAFLRRLREGDAVVLETPEGGRVRYTVRRTVVVDAADTWVAGPSPGRVLTLVTCWPFDAVVPGGPERYVVWAEARDAGGGR